MRLLISVDNSEDAALVASRPVDILDLKNPAEGSLGAAPPWLIGEVMAQLGRLERRVAVSVALGDLHDQPGTAALAAAGAAAYGVQFVKAGLRWLDSSRQAQQLMLAVRRAVHDVSSTCLVVAAGYADYRRVGGLPPKAILAAAQQAGADIVMLDTAVKDGASLIDALSYDELDRFRADARAAGLGVAFAGALKPADLATLVALELEFIGLRGAVCVGGDRKQRVCLQKLDALLSHRSLGHGARSDVAPSG